MNNHRSYYDLNIFNLLNSMNKPCVIYDGWNMFPYHEIQNIPGVIYTATGFGSLKKEVIE